MSKKETEFCIYTSVKVDEEVMHLVRIAAARQRKSVQEYISGVLNQTGSSDSGEKPIKRKPPKPRRSDT